VIIQKERFEMSKKRALVTGGAGFIGSHIVDSLANLGHEVLVIDDLSSGKRENINPQATFLQANICSKEAHNAIESFRPTVVSHHAAQMDVRHSVSDPAFDAQINISGLCNVMEGARKGGALQQVVFASSGGAMYGEQDVYPAPESHPVRPESPYGLSKWVGERYLDWYHRIYGFNTCALRYGNIYGPRQNPHGEAGVIAIFCNRLIEENDITIFGDGKQTRDYVYVFDVVKAHTAAIEKQLNGGFNVGTGLETDVLTLAQVLQDEMRPHVSRLGEIQMAEARPGEQQRSVIDASLLKSHTGFCPQTPLTEGLAETARFFREQGNT